MVNLSIKVIDLVNRQAGNEEVVLVATAGGDGVMQMILLLVVAVGYLKSS